MSASQRIAFAVFPPGLPGPALAPSSRWLQAEETLPARQQPVVQLSSSPSSNFQALALGNDLVGSVSWRAAAAAFTVAVGVTSSKRSRRRGGGKARRKAQPFGSSEPEFPVLENLRRKGSDLPSAPQEQGSENFEPIAEFKAIKENPLGSWGFLTDEDFGKNIAALFGGAFVIGAIFMSWVFPPLDTSGGLVFKNVIADGLFASGFGTVVIAAALLYMGQQWSNVDKALRKEKYTVEYDPTVKMDYTSGPGGAYSYQQVKSKKAVERDRLIAEYDVEPALTRLRSYLAASLLASLALPALGSSMGAEMSMAPPEDPEDKCKTASKCARLYSIAPGTRIQPYIR